MLIQRERVGTVDPFVAVGDSWACGTCIAGIVLRRSVVLSLSSHAAEGANAAHHRQRGVREFSMYRGGQMPFPIDARTKVQDVLRLRKDFAQDDIVQGAPLMTSKTKTIGPFVHFHNLFGFGLFGSE